MTTHSGILKLNEFLNLKMTKDIDNIRSTYLYKSIFINSKLFNQLREFLVKNKLSKPDSNLNMIASFYYTIKSNKVDYNMIKTPELLSLYKILYKIINSNNKISFSSRVRYGELFAIYSEQELIIKTNKLTINQFINFQKEIIKPLIDNKILSIIDLQVKIESSDLYKKIFENTKKTISHLNSRKYSSFAIASWLYYCNSKIISKPFLYNWSNYNFFKALITTKLFINEVPQDIKDQIPKDIDFWSILSESSLLTGKVTNIDSRRRLINTIINGALNSEGEYYISQFLNHIKLVQSNNPITPFKVINYDEAYKESTNYIKNLIKSLSPGLGSKEDLIQAIKFQFFKSKILGYDFSSKRKDHLILNNSTKKRLFDIL